MQSFRSRSLGVQQPTWRRPDARGPGLAPRAVVQTLQHLHDEYKGSFRIGLSDCVESVCAAALEGKTSSSCRRAEFLVLHIHGRSIDWCVTSGASLYDV